MRSTRALALVTALVAGLLAAGSAATASEGSQASAYAGSSQVSSDVVGDDANELYRGTGGLVIPERDWSEGGSSRREVAGCQDCEWKITRLCTKKELAESGCRRLHVGCPVGTIPVRVWLRHVPGDWIVAGTRCQGDTPPRTVTDVGGEVRAEAVKLLPPLRGQVQPPTAALVRVPVLGRTGQPAAGIRDADLSVLGVDVSLDARVRWRWDWSDGAPQWTSDPGGRWPNTGVSHTFRTAGTRTVAVTAVWRGDFMVEGLGPFDVPGPPLTQDDTVTIDVREARAVLTR